LDDWLQAERDVVSSPPSELIDHENEFRARIALPGLDAKDIQVSAMPDALVIHADAGQNHTSELGEVRFCEFSAKTQFRWLELNAPIEVDRVPHHWTRAY
jgi:HSP20 family molecular chaperone IbpA